MITETYYKVNLYQKKLREGGLEQLVINDGLHPTEVKYFFDLKEAEIQYNKTPSGTYQIYGRNMFLCQGKTLIKSVAKFDEDSLPDNIRNKRCGLQEYLKELDNFSTGETKLESRFPEFSDMPNNAALNTCYYYSDYLKCILPESESGNYTWCVYYQRNKRDCYHIHYDNQHYEWFIGNRFVAKDQAPLSPDEICKRVNEYVCLIGDIMYNLHSRKYERRAPDYKPSEDTFVAKAAKAGISTRTLYKRRKELNRDNLTEEELKPRRRGKKPKKK